LISIFFGHSLIDLCDFKLIKHLGKIVPCIRAIFSKTLFTICFAICVSQLFKLSEDYKTKTRVNLDYQVGAELKSFSLSLCFDLNLIKKNQSINMIESLASLNNKTHGADKLLKQIKLNRHLITPINKQIYFFRNSKCIRIDID